jgi:hypothetical protein
MVERSYPNFQTPYPSRRRSFWRRDDDPSPYITGREQTEQLRTNFYCDGQRDREREQTGRQGLDPKYIPRPTIPRPNSPGNRMGSINGDYWYTPLEEIEKIQLLLPGFWDPCPIAAEFDGLETEWPDSCFINPPFSKIEEFVRKGCQEWTPEKSFIWLVNADFKTEVGITLTSLANVIAVTKTPLRFRPGNSTLLKSENKFRSAYFLWTTDEQVSRAFQECFSGDCVILNVQK